MAYTHIFGYLFQYKRKKAENKVRLFGHIG